MVASAVVEWGLAGNCTVEGTGQVSCTRRLRVAFGLGDLRLDYVILHTPRNVVCALARRRPEILRRGRESQDRRVRNGLQDRIEVQRIGERCVRNGAPRAGVERALGCRARCRVADGYLQGSRHGVSQRPAQAQAAVNVGYILTVSPSTSATAPLMRPTLRFGLLLTQPWISHGSGWVIG